MNSPHSSLIHVYARDTGNTFVFVVSTDNRDGFHIMIIMFDMVYWFRIVSYLYVSNCSTCLHIFPYVSFVSLESVCGMLKYRLRFLCFLTARARNLMLNIKVGRRLDSRHDITSR